MATSLLCIFLMAVPGALGYSSGSPPTGCVTQIPGHKVSPQNSASPYTISAAGSTYRAGQKVQVTISGEFQGFMVQARTANGTTVGTFFDFPTGTKTTTCSAAEDTWTHNSKAAKRDIVVTWNPPTGDVGPVKFRGTVLQSFPTFWVGLESSTLSYSSGQSAGGETSTPGNGGDPYTESTTTYPGLTNNGTAFEYTAKPTVFSDVCRIRASALLTGLVLGITMAY